MMKNINLNERTDQSGFTLVELMIAVAVSAIVLTAMVSVFSNQQKTFATQSDLARSQASARAALFVMARDIRMAGYTGIPLGINNLMKPGPQSPPLTGYMPYPVISIRSEGSVISGLVQETNIANSLASKTLDADGKQTDILEIWGNFSRRSTKLSAPAAGGAMSVTVADPTLFSGKGFNKPGWVVIGNANSEIRCYRITNDPSVTPGQLSISPPLVEAADGNTIPGSSPSFVAPLYRRIYYVEPQRQVNGRTVPTLWMRNCLDDNCVTPTTGYEEEILAQSVYDLDFSFASRSIMMPEQQVIGGQQIVCDPCGIRMVSIEIKTRSEVFRESDNPIERVFSSSVKVRNIGIQGSQCGILGCVSL